MCVFLSIVNIIHIFLFKVVAVTIICSCQCLLSKSHNSFMFVRCEFRLFSSACIERNAIRHFKLIKKHMSNCIILIFFPTLTALENWSERATEWESSPHLKCAIWYSIVLWLSNVSDELYLRRLKPDFPFLKSAHELRDSFDNHN